MSVGFYLIFTVLFFWGGCNYHLLSKHHTSCNQLADLQSYWPLWGQFGRYGIMKPHWHDEKWHFSTWIHQSQEHETHRIHRNHSIWSVTYEYLSVILILSQSLFLDLSASLVLVNHKKIDPKSLGSKSVGSWILSSFCHQFALWIYSPAASAERPNVNAHSAKALRVHLFLTGATQSTQKMEDESNQIVSGWWLT